MKSQEFDALLMRALKRQNKADEASVERVLARLSGPVPRQQLPFWRLPAVLLDWQFAPAWPRVAALGACAVIGFAIGLSGVDRRIDRTDTAVITSGGIGSIVFEPEPLTGAQP